MLEESYEHWKWRAIDLIGRVFADTLGISREYQWSAGVSAVREQKRMVYMPLRFMLRMIRCSDIANVEADSWEACSEFFDLADMLKDSDDCV